MKTEEIKLALMEGKQLQLGAYCFCYWKHKQIFHMFCRDYCCDSEYESFEDFKKHWGKDFNEMYIAEPL